MSFHLYHGPGAWEAAFSREQDGRRLGGPFGQQGLEIEDARTIVALSSQLPPGRDKCIVVVGPMDGATPASADVLLKLIEEPPRRLEVVLWANEIHNVVPTIVSRCWPKWCPGEETYEGLEDAKYLLEAYLEHRVDDISRVLTSNKESLKELCRSLVFLIRSDNSFKKTDLLPIWSTLRPLLQEEQVSHLGLFSSLLLSMQ